LPVSLSDTGEKLARCVDQAEDQVVKAIVEQDIHIITVAAV
jgi:hypothetical protein